MNLINELIPVINFSYVKPIIKCAIFKENQSTITVEKALLMLLRTKNFSLKYYYFR